MKKEYIYLNTNPDNEEVIKVGKTTKKPILRAKEMDRKSHNVNDWIVEKYWEVFDCTIAEKIAHYCLELEGCRVDGKKELFKINKEQAIEILDKNLTVFSCLMSKEGVENTFFENQRYIAELKTKILGLEQNKIDLENVLSKQQVKIENLESNIIDNEQKMEGLCFLHKDLDFTLLKENEITSKSKISITNNCISCEIIDDSLMNHNHTYELLIKTLQKYLNKINLEGYDGRSGESCIITLNKDIQECLFIYIGKYWSNSFEIEIEKYESLVDFYYNLLNYTNESSETDFEELAIDSPLVFFNNLLKEKLSQYELLHTREHSFMCNETQVFRTEKTFVYVKLLENTHFEILPITHPHNFETFGFCGNDWQQFFYDYKNGKTIFQKEIKGKVFDNMQDFVGKLSSYFSYYSEYAILEIDELNLSKEMIDLLREILTEKHQEHSNKEWID